MISPPNHLSLSSTFSAYTGVTGIVCPKNGSCFGGSLLFLKYFGLSKVAFSIQNFAVKKRVQPVEKFNNAGEVLPKV